MLKKTTWLLIGRFTSDGLSFLFYLCLARTFGESGIGDYAFAFALAAVFGLGIELGLRHLITRDVARNHELAADYFGNILVLQLVLAFMIGLLLHFLSVRLDYSNQVHFLLTMAFIGVALKATGLSFVSFLEAIEAMDKSALLEIFARVTMVAFGFVLILAGASLQIVMLAHVIGGAIYLGMAIHSAQRHFGPLPFTLDPYFIKNIVVAALPFAGSSALYVLYSRVDIMMLHHFIGKEETGLYAVAFRCIETPLIVASLVGVAMYPTLSRASVKKVADQNALFLSTLKWLGMLGMIGAVTLISVGDKLVIMLFGQEFADAGELIRWMAVLFFIGCIKVPYWRLLFARNLERTVLGIQGTSVALNLVLNILLIPLWGAHGAVRASIISEVFLAVALHSSCARLVSARYITMASRLLFAGGISAVAGILLREFLPWPLIVGVMLMSLVGVSLAFRIITLEDHRRFTGGLNALYVKTVGGSDSHA